jgi:hypothetical protein
LIRSRLKNKKNKILITLQNYEIFNHKQTKNKKERKTLFSQRRLKFPRRVLGEGAGKWHPRVLCPDTR